MSAAVMPTDSRNQRKVGPSLTRPRSAYVMKSAPPSAVSGIVTKKNMDNLEGGLRRKQQKSIDQHYHEIVNMHSQVAAETVGESPRQAPNPTTSQHQELLIAPAADQPLPIDKKHHHHSQHLQQQHDPFAYRAYIPTVPCANKLLQHKWDKVSLRSHTEKLKNATKTIDTAPPKQYSHLVSQRRKRRAKMEYDSKIFYENQLLLHRIRTKTSTLPTPAPPAQPPTWNPLKKRIYSEQQEQNQMLLQRLEDAEAYYSQEKFKEGRVEVLRHLGRISRFPRRFYQELEGLVGHDDNEEYTSENDNDEDEDEQGHLAGSLRPVSAPGGLRKDRKVGERPGSSLCAVQLKRPSTSRGRISNVSDSNANSPTTNIEAKSSKPSTSDEAPTFTPEVPPRYQPRVPLVPRCATVRPKSAPAPPTSPPKPTRKVPLVPRVATLAKKPETPLPNSKPSVKREAQSLDSLFETDTNGSRYDYPGSEELHIPPAFFEWDPWPTSTSESKREDGKGRVFEEKFDPGRAFVYSLLPPNIAEQQNVLGGYGGGMGGGGSVHVYVSNNCMVNTKIPRHEFWAKKVGELRELAMGLAGVEFRVFDPSWGIQESEAVDPVELRKATHWELEKCLKESISLSHIAFHSIQPSTPQSFSLPTIIPTALFQRLLKHINRVDSKSAELLSAWFKDNGNGKTTLQFTRNFQKLVQQFHSDTGKSWTEWKDHVEPALREALTAAAVRISRKGEIGAAMTQRFLESGYQEEVLRGLVRLGKRGEWERGVVGVCEEAMDGGAKDEECEDGGQNDGKRMLKKLEAVMFSAVPYENKVKPADLHNPASLADSLHALVSKLILRNLSSMPSPTPSISVFSEAASHLLYLRPKSKDHVRREHLIEKTVNYITRVEPWPLPPLVILGGAGAGRCSVISKALHKLSALLPDSSFWLQKQKEGNAFLSTSGSSAPAPSTSVFANSSSFAHGTDTSKSPDVFMSGNMTSTTQIASGNLLRRKSSVHCTAIRPVVVVRVAGLTPESSTHHKLMQSITMQIRASYGVPPLEEPSSLSTPHKSWPCGEGVYTVSAFRKCLSLATQERPLVIVVAKIDRLEFSDPTNLRISWLVDCIPPYVRIVLAGREEKNPTRGSYTSLLKLKVQEMAPQALILSLKGIPPADAELLAASDAYLLKPGELITPVIKATLRKWTDLDVEGKLGAESEQSLVKAYLGTSPSPVRILKLQYQLARAHEGQESLPKDEAAVAMVHPRTILMGLDTLLADLELKHGKQLTIAALCYLIVSRDGLTRTELEDLLSLEDTVLEESFKQSGAATLDPQKTPPKSGFIACHFIFLASSVEPRENHTQEPYKV
ncbi:hypothetical protein HDV05_005135 [Chytridiales sp. JEL 0842]|nr:hypothetical protein HDV05_005135 [Chytridiales sp. JEL 0842]